MEQKVYKIPSDNFPTLKEKFAKLGKRAIKLNLPEPTFTEIKVERIEKKNPHTDLVEEVYLLHHITVDPGCAVVKILGWEFVATIQHTDDGNIVRAVGNQTVPVQYREADRYCDHCQTNRKRKDTYVIFNEEKQEYKKVGRDCLQNYFGHDALLLAERAQYLVDIDSLGESLEDGFGFGGPGPRYQMLEKLLAYTAEVIKLDGWMSRTKAKELGLEHSATCEVAQAYIENRVKNRAFQYPTEESVKVGNDAMEWAANLEGEDIHEYLHNIRVIARRTVYEGRDLGLASSIVAAYQRHLMTLRYKELLAKRGEVAQYVGQVGDRIRVKVMVEKVIQFDSAYGISHLHIMSDTNGNVFIWFSSAGAKETGKEIILNGRIKAHNERDGVKQNVLTRCEEIQLHTYFAIVNDARHTFEAASESEVRKLLRAKLDVSKLPNGLKIIQDIPQKEGEET